MTSEGKAYHLSQTGATWVDFTLAKTSIYSAVAGRSWKNIYPGHSWKCEIWVMWYIQSWQLMCFSVQKNEMLNNQFEEDSTNPPFWGIQPPKPRRFRPISAEPRRVGRCCLWGTRLTAPLGQTYPWHFTASKLKLVGRVERCSQRMWVKHGETNIHKGSHRNIIGKTMGKPGENGGLPSGKR